MLVTLLQRKPSFGRYACQCSLFLLLKPRPCKVAQHRTEGGDHRVLGRAEQVELGSTWDTSDRVPGSLSRYHLVVIALIYFLPLTVMFVAYSIIGLTLWRRAVPRHQVHGANLRHLRAKKKVSSRDIAVQAAPPYPCWSRPTGYGALRPTDHLVTCPCAPPGARSEFFPLSRWMDLWSLGKYKTKGIS
jgi:hypothetical protein